jgi:hypothetical protein
VQNARRARWASLPDDDDLGRPRAAALPRRWRHAVLRALPLALLVLVVSSCGGGDGQPGARSDRAASSTAAPDTPGAPGDSVVASVPGGDAPPGSGAKSEAEHDSALAYNLALTRSVRTAVDSRMPDLPERIYDYGMRHGRVSVYETLSSGRIVDTPGNLKTMERGSAKNVLVSLPTGELFLRYLITPEGGRVALNIRVKALTPSKDVRYRLELAMHEIADVQRNYFVASYFDRETFATQGHNGSSALTGERCTVDPARVEAILAKMDTDLQG